MAETFEGAIGIDLGTTFSCVAVFLNNKVDVIPNDQGNRTTPSKVAYGGPQMLVGDAAASLVAKTPKSVIYDSKRLIGRKFTDKEVQKDLKIWPFDVEKEEGDSDGIRICVDHGSERLKLKPEQVSARILEYLKTCAERHLGKKVKKAVITVPAYFNDAQRERTKAAGAIAGLDVLRIVNEPTAAALAYGIDGTAAGGEAQNILVFDFGGGTFDVSIVTIDMGAFEVRATAGDTHLGGQDIDAVLVEYFLAEAKKKGHDLRENEKALAKLRRAAEQCKRGLSHKHDHEVELEGILGGDDFNMKISRPKFEEMCDGLFKKCIDTVKRALADAKMGPKDIGEIVMVGGSSRIPKICSLVSDFFGGRTLNNRVSPDEAIAVGAAIQASILSKAKEQQSDKTEGLILMDVLPLSIGVDVDEGKFDVIIPRNSTIPYKKTKEYSTVERNQREVTVEIYEGERPLTKHNRKLGAFTLDGISKAPKGEPSIWVTFSVDANGILTVTAEEESKKKKQMLTVKNDNRLTDEEVAKMIEEAEKMREQDEAASKIHSMIVDAEGSLREARMDLQNHFRSSGETPPKVAKLFKVIDGALEWLETKGKEQTSTAFVSIRTQKMAKVVRKAKKQVKKARKAAARAAGEQVSDDEPEEASSGDEGEAGGGEDAPVKKKSRHEGGEQQDHANSSQ